MNLLGAASYPGQVLYLCVSGDAGSAFFPTVLHVSQMEHAGDDVQQLLHRDKDNGDQGWKIDQESGVKARRFWKDAAQYDLSRC